MLLLICGLGKHDPGTRPADFVVLLYHRVFRCTLGPFVQFTPRLINAPIERDYFLQVLLIFLRTNKAKLRQADYGV